MIQLRPWFVVAVLSLGSCSGSTEPTEGAEEPAPVHPTTPELTVEELETDAENFTLVPSPVETQRALERAGIETQLSTLITGKELDVANEDQDNAAVRTGVVIADVLLTVKSSPKEDLLMRLSQVEAGMTQLDAGEDILKTLDDIQERVKGDAVTRDELLKELDELSGAVIPELEFNGRERIVPLIQAGSWLEGANLLAKAVKAAEKPAAADELLKQPAVVDYFLKYVREEGADSAPAAVTEKLEESLETLKGIASKEGSLTMEDIDTVIQVTDDVLALL